MKNFEDKVAVISGAASGIGRGLAERCCQKGMKVVLADVEAEALWQTEKELKANGATILAVQTDVSRPDHVEALAHKTLEAFEAVHLLFNNAGVGAGGAIWESTQADWEWVMGVNLWGVIHGLRIFVPIMLEQETDCYVVNTASIAGLLPYHPSASYGVTKRAVVALSEQLHYELAQKQAKIKVSVLCPGWINTRILESTRNRPTSFQNENDPAQIASNAATGAMSKSMRQALEEGSSPLQAADHIFEAINEEKFYILFNATEFMSGIQTRLENVLQGRNPTYPAS